MKQTLIMALTGAGAAALFAGSALAQEAYQIPQITVYTQDGTAITTTGQISLRPEIVRQVATTSRSTADALKQVPGMQTQAAGGVSSLPVLRGFADDRLNQTVNGAAITSACANHMNPPLSYTDPSQIDSVQVSLPVSGVSDGGDSIGGGIQVVTNTPKFAAPDTSIPGKTEPVPDKTWSGNLHARYSSNGNMVTVGGKAEAHNEWASLSYAGDWGTRGHTKDGHGDRIPATEYEAHNHEVTLGLKGDLGVTTLKAHAQKIPYQGYTNQRMDMTDNEAWGISAEQKMETGLGEVTALAYYNSVEHVMNFLPDKKYSRTPPRDMPMLTDGQDFGYRLALKRDLADGSTLRLGNELHRQLLDEWWPPVGTVVNNMCCNDYWLINGGERTRLGTFLELDKKLSDKWSALVGLRSDIVWMNTGNVQGYNTGATYGPDAAAFNAKDHSMTDYNFDATAMLKFKPSDGVTFEGGYARKTRSPNFYERYAWSTVAAAQMAKNMVGWFGDGNGYIGNLEVDPEVAHNFSITARFADPVENAWEVSVSPYISYVDDYIGAKQVSVSTMPAGFGFVNLQYVNHDALLYGFDAAGRVRVVKDSAIGDVELKGVVSFTRGKNLDFGESLYHMMPLNARVEVRQSRDGWSNALELVAVADKTRVDSERNELTTDDYFLVNFRSAWENDRIRLDAGVENIFDSYFEDPLGGINVGPAMPPVTVTGRGNVPGMGRTFYAGFTVKF